MRTAIAVALFANSAWASNTTVTVDASRHFQTLAGFGATHDASSLIGNNDSKIDSLTPAALAQAIDMAYRQVRLTTGNLGSSVHEGPVGTFTNQNDNSDPFTIDWTGFDGVSNAFMKTGLLDAAPTTFNDYEFGQQVNARWASPWQCAIRATDYNAYLNEIAEQFVADAAWWMKTYGMRNPREHLYNEPTTGNGQLNCAGVTTQDLADITRTVGARMADAGFPTQFIVPNEERVASSLASATAILADPGARQYVAAIGYHTYPYGGVYSSVPNILSTSGTGSPDATEVAARRQLKALGDQYGLPTRMTEVSHGNVDTRSFDDLRGRAIQIHDEMAYAGASAFYAMQNFFNSQASYGHGVGSDIYANEGDAVDVDNWCGGPALPPTCDGTVFITGMGYAIGHYARWTTPFRTARVYNDHDAFDDPLNTDKLLEVSTFVDDAAGNLVAVVINNHTDATQSYGVTLVLQNIAVSGQVTGEQSTGDGTANNYSNAWQAIAGFNPQSPTSIAINVPALSVTTLSVGIAGRDAGTAPPDAGLMDAGRSFDAGLVSDGGTSADSGAPADAGSETGVNKAAGGCGCTGAAPVPWVLGCVGCALAWRKRRAPRRTVRATGFRSRTTR